MTCVCGSKTYFLCPTIPYYLSSFFLNLIPFAGGMRAFMFFFGREMEGGGSAFW